MANANVELTEENFDAFEEQLTPANCIYTLDCMKLNPEINEMTRGGYDLSIYKINFQEKEVYAVHFDDGFDGDVDDAIAQFRLTDDENEAHEILVTEYNDWLKRF